MSEPFDVMVCYVPVDDTEAVLEALFDAGAGKMGRYDRCAWTTSGMGQFRPLPGADPTIGDVGDEEQVPENRIELAVPRALRATVVELLRKVHPYEEPAFHVLRNVADEQQ